MSATIAPVNTASQPYQSSSGPNANASGAAGTDQQQSDSISLSPLAAGSLLTIGGLAAAGAAVGAYTYGKNNAPKPQQSLQTPSEPAQQPPTQAPPRVENTSVATHNRIKGAGTIEVMPHYAHGAPAPQGVEDPFQLNSPRFHPAQSGANCAVDTVNMLVNGYEPLRITNTDYAAIKAGYEPDGSGGSAHDNSGTVTEPSRFPAIYAKNFEVAKHHLQQLKRQKPEHKALYDQDSATVANMQKKYGALSHKVFSLARTPKANQQAMLLKSALNGFTGRTIAIAMPLKHHIFGVPQELHQFEHHYFTIERQDDGTWLRRSSSKADTDLLLLSNHQPARSAFEAVAAVCAGNPDDDKAQDPRREIHVFIPRPVR